MENEYYIGDLVSIHSRCLGVIYNKKRRGSQPVYYYQIHFCEEIDPDPRWVFPEDIRDQVRKI